MGMTNGTKPRVAVVGAGIGGLTLALALLQRGIPVNVYESASELREVGAGLHCTPNGTRVMFALGLEAPLTRVADRPTERDVRLWNTGQAWQLPGHGTTSVERYGVPYLLLYRPDLVAVLADAINARDPSVVHLGATCVGFEQGETGVELILKSGERVAADVLVGADGIHSMVRDRLFGPTAPVFTGDICWRGLVPMERLPRQSRTQVSNWIGPNGSITLYPIRGGALLNVVAVTERDDWQRESWTEQGTHEECLSDFPGWHEDIHEILRNIDVPYKWGLFLREPSAQWSEGRATLLGDSCHSTLPYLGQGGNLAMEDGLILARCLEKYAADPRAGLLVYENERRQRAADIVRQSSGQAKLVRSKRLGDPDAAHYVEETWAPRNVGARYDWIFDYDASRVEL